MLGRNHDDYLDSGCVNIPASIQLQLSIKEHISLQLGINTKFLHVNDSKSSISFVRLAADVSSKPSGDAPPCRPPA